MDPRPESLSVRTMPLLNFTSREPELAKTAAAETFFEVALEVLIEWFS